MGWLLQPDVDLRGNGGEVAGAAFILRCPGRADRVLKGRAELPLGVRLDLDDPVPGAAAFRPKDDQDGLASVVVPPALVVLQRALDGELAARVHDGRGYAAANDPVIGLPGQHCAA